MLSFWCCDLASGHYDNQLTVVLVNFQISRLTYIKKLADSWFVSVAEIAQDS